MRSPFRLSAALFSLFVTPLACSSAPARPPPARPPSAVASSKPSQAPPPADAAAPAASPVFLWHDAPSPPNVVRAPIPPSTHLASSDWLAEITPSGDPGSPGPLVSVPWIPTLPEKPAPVGPSLADEEARRKAAAILARVRRCYVKALEIRPDLSGKVMFQLLVGPDGLIKTASVKSSTVGDSTLEDCALAAFRSAEFPPPEDEASLIIPIMFQPPTE